MNSAPGDEELPLVEHLKELRTRMMTAAVPVILIMAIAFFFSGQLLQFIWKQTVALPMTIYSPMELILTKLSLSLVCGLFLGIPLIIYEFFMFIGKGLYPNEKKFFLKIVLPSFILFVFGAILAFYVAVPLTFRYTILYSTDVAMPQISVIKTIYTILILVVGFGVIFQFPLLLLFSMKMGLVKAKDLRGKRKFIYGAFLALAFLISPDPTAISELLVAAVLIVLFEISLVVSRIF